MCCAAKKKGVEPLVISKTYGIEPHPWQNKILLEYPSFSQMRGSYHVFKLQQRLSAWPHMRQKAYAKNVVRAIREAKIADWPMVLHNDPEMAVYLRKCFPKAFILHHTHNNNTTHKTFRRAFAGAVDVATAVSDHCRKWNEEYFGFAPDKMGLLYNGINLETFTPPAKPAAGIPIVNFVGRVCADKGPDLILSAAQQLNDLSGKFRVRILGSNHWGVPEENEYIRGFRVLIEETRDKGIEVEWPGFINRHELPELLRQAHMNVVPSRWDEPFGLVSLEGMASGLATIVARVGGLPEVVGDSGLLFERDDVAQLAQHLRTLIENPEKRLELARTGSARAQGFGWENTWNTLHGFLPPSVQ